MSDITRAEFNALVQKVDEIHRMLKARPPSVYPIPPFVISDPVPTVTLPVIVMKGDTNGQ